MKPKVVKKCPNCHRESYLDLPICTTCKYDYNLKRVNPNYYSDYADELDRLLGSSESDNALEGTSSSSMTCPSCSSVNLTTNTKGFSFGKAATGAILVGPLGLLAGGIGSNKVLITCLDCGKSFKAGNYQEEKRKADELRRLEDEPPTAGLLLFMMIASGASIMFTISLFKNDWFFIGIIFALLSLFLVAMLIYFLYDVSKPR